MVFERQLLRLGISFRVKLLSAWFILQVTFVPDSMAIGCHQVIQRFAIDRQQVLYNIISSHLTSILQ
jgi:hypothetical protein